MSDTLPKHRAPWARPGWYAEATSWMQAQLAKLDYKLTAPIEQVKSWCLSCILRAHTTAGDVYFKVAADLPLFVNEAVSYQYILANVEDAARQDFGWAMPFWVGKILKQQHVSSSGQGEHSGR